MPTAPTSPGPATNRIDRCFHALAARQRKALIAYLCVGDPSADESFALARACVDAGADMLELGVPFSDPTADGPAIARASQRAIAKGAGLLPTLEVARRLRAAGCEAPIVLFGYANPLYIHGLAKSVAAAEGAGVDALLVVDLPVDEAQPLRDEARGRGLHVIPLLAPTSSDERIAAVAAAAQQHAGGFVYYVSVAGVTGSATAPLAEASARAGLLRRRVGLPTVVGFGIDSGERAQVAARDADGVVVGTALVKAIEDGTTAEGRLSAVTALVSSLRSALDASP